MSENKAVLSCTALFIVIEGERMNSRVAVISIIVENMESTAEINKLLHANADYIIGRMGIPYREKNVNLISIFIDAPETVINGLTGRIGKLGGVTAKTAYSNVIS